MPRSDAIGLRPLAKLLLYYFSFVCIISICVYVCISCLIFFIVPLVRSWRYRDAVHSVFYFTFSFYFYCVPCVRFHNKINTAKHLSRSRWRLNASNKIHCCHWRWRCLAAFLDFCFPPRRWLRTRWRSTEHREEPTWCTRHTVGSSDCVCWLQSLYTQNTHDRLRKIFTYLLTYLTWNALIRNAFPYLWSECATGGLANYNLQTVSCGKKSTTGNAFHGSTSRISTLVWSISIFIEAVVLCS